MNRAIEFIGLRTDGKGWVFGYYYEEELLYGSHSHIIYSDVDDENDEQTKQYSVHVFRESVGQYHNSLSEKTKGKRVYVGDIISFDLKEGLGEPKTFNCTQVIETIEMSSFWYCNVRVVGNIHENK